MKISWPWKQKKLLSLFDGPVGRPLDTLSVGHSRIARGRVPDKPYPKNAPGPFYVVNSDCMTCGYPHVLAPDLMAWDIDAEGHERHCYFKKQPGTPEQIDQAVAAIKGGCCGALRYSGADVEILKRIS